MSTVRKSSLPWDLVSTIVARIRSGRALRSVVDGGLTIPLMFPIIPLAFASSVRNLEIWRWMRSRLQCVSFRLNPGMLLSSANDAANVQDASFDGTLALSVRPVCNASSPAAESGASAPPPTTWKASHPDPTCPYGMQPTNVTTLTGLAPYGDSGLITKCQQQHDLLQAAACPTGTWSASANWGVDPTVCCCPPPAATPAPPMQCAGGRTPTKVTELKGLASGSALAARCEQERDARRAAECP
eukprot:gene9338-14484_t